MRTTATTTTKVMPCSQCGTPLTVGKNTRKAPKCTECGVQNAIKNALEIHTKSGPYYDKWRAAMSRAFADE